MKYYSAIMKNGIYRTIDGPGKYDIKWGDSNSERKTKCRFFLMWILDYYTMYLGGCGLKGNSEIGSVVGVRPP